jgi:Tfp pilus assembly protein PilW
VLGVVLIGGVISVLLANKQSYKTNSALSQLQDNARTAFEMMARDIRQAGSTPCGNTTVTNNLASLNGTNTDWYLCHHRLTRPDRGDCPECSWRTSKRHCYSWRGAGEH